MSVGNETSSESTAPAAEAGFPIDVDSALHPFETSRLALALGGGFVVLTGAVGFFIATFGLEGLLVAGLVLGVTVGSIWLAVQVFRARLLGNGIKVEPGSLTDVHNALTTVRKQLGYYRRVDVYVVAELNGKAIWLNFLGHRVIVLEGDLVASLTATEGQAGLRFLIGSFLGALKARHARVLPLLLLLQLFDAVKFAILFILPYYRATRYSGDQLGYLCSGDLKAAMGAVSRLLVGNETAPSLAVRGVINQTELVQQAALPRLAQLVSDAPHLVNRYLNVLAFAARVAPQEFQAFVADLEEDTRQRLWLLMMSTPHAAQRPVGRWPQRRPVWPTYLGIGLVMAAVALVVGFVWLKPGSDEGSEQASSTSVEPTTTAPSSMYTAEELFGAETMNGTCETTVPQNTLTGHETEEVSCYDDNYSRYFYKYSGTDSAGWVAAVRAGGVFSDLSFYESGSCLDTYTATYTLDGSTYYNTALFVFHSQPFVAGVSAEASLTDVATVVNAGFYANEDAVLC